ncbi:MULTISPECIES: hypothetical protein [unclassified Acinetobacter]|uniref:hypothetical protein n=1 Tax=unclassified Acinetobacter TaxID=196816 RepID=UPI0035B71408
MSSLSITHLTRPLGLTPIVANPHCDVALGFQPKLNWAKALLEYIQQNQIDILDIVQKLGYQSNHYLHAKKRFIAVMNSDSLGLYDAPYDLKYNRAEYLNCLLRALNLQNTAFQNQLDEIISRANQQRSKQHYQLKAKLTLRHQPSIMTRFAIAKQFEYIDLPSYFDQLNKFEQQHYIYFHIEQHYQQYRDAIPYQGTIDCYEFLREGRLLENIDCPIL